ncbi:MAG TPA: S41 family peptidase [Steroidobacteraceae bacterium]|jgi:carboxyl-terminal processing protease|nr:S41 family peptidase [Steroidobacteraceae bacterium]
MKMLALGIVLGVLIALGGTVFAHRDAPAPTVTKAVVATPSRAPLSAADSAQIAEVYERVQREYVDKVEGPRLIDDALRGMVGRLDPYSSFLDAEEYADLRVSTAGTYAGIGIEVSTADRALRVVRPFRDSPAAVAGIQSGDMISAIDGMPVGSDLDTAMSRMRGPRGSTVKLAVVRAGSALPLEFTVVRAQVDVHSVGLVRLDDGYFYARIMTFSDTTAMDFAAGVARLRRDLGSKPRGLILDLRNNPGGVLESAVEVADQMLEDGVIVTADGRTPAARFSMSATPGEVLSGVPVVVLVNGATASAAEILAGALQDHHRAVLLGQRTYGKGLVQTVMPLTSGRAIKLTTSRYYTPSGRSIQGSGIEPDQPYEMEDQPLDLEDPQARLLLAQRDNGVRAALEVLKGRKPRAAPPGLTASTAGARHKG